MFICQGILSSEFIKLTSDVKSHLRCEGDYYAGWEYVDEDTVGHSGGTPNYSSRILFSQKRKTGVCVPTLYTVIPHACMFLNNYWRRSRGTMFRKKPVITGFFGVQCNLGTWILQKIQD